MSLIRVRVDQTLFNGVPDDPYSPAHYCDCPSTGTTINRMCNRNALVDTSNINRGMPLPSGLFSFIVTV